MARALVGWTAALVCVTLTVHAEPPASNHPKIQRLPAAVRGVVRAEVGEGRIDSIHREAQDGEVTFEVDLNRAGKERSFVVSRAGVLLETEVFLEELPAAVQQTIRSTTSGATLGEMDKTFDEGRVEYDIEMTRAGAERDFTVAADGRLLTMEIPFSAAPIKAQGTIQSELPGAVPETVEINYEEGTPTYDVTFTRHGQEHDLSVAANGDLVSEEMEVADLPKEAAGAVQQLAGAGHSLDITKSIENGDVSFDVSLPDQSVTWTLATNGWVMLEERRIELTAAPGPVQAALKTRLPANAIPALTKSTADKDVTFEASWTAHGTNQTVTLLPSGEPAPADE